MNRTLAILSQIGFWCCYLFLAMVMLAVLYGAEEESNTEEMMFTMEIFCKVAIVPSAITFYSFYFFLFPKYVQKRQVGPAILYGLLISGIAALTGLLLVQEEFSSLCQVDRDQGAEAIHWVFIFIWIIALFAGGMSLVIQGFLNWLKEMKLQEVLRAKNQEMELALVKAQLDPHFLFNTINNIDVLILKNAERASNYLQKLSDIMRFILYETKPSTIPLDKEIAYMDKYIELQKIRTANQHYVDFKVCGDPTGRNIVPMVLIPFVENAFKHTTNKKIKDAIQVQIQIARNHIRFRCQNRYDADRLARTEANGLGNALIEKRLNLMYAERYQLNIQNNNNHYCVDLIIEDE